MLAACRTRNWCLHLVMTPLDGLGRGHKSASPGGTCRQLAHEWRVHKKKFGPGVSRFPTTFNPELCRDTSMTAVTKTPFGLRGEPLQRFMIFVVVVPTFVAMGFSQSFFGGIVSYKSVYTMFEEINTTTTKGAVQAHNSLIQGTVNACLNLGAVMGCLSCMYIGNKLGRRRTLAIGAILDVAGTAIFASSYSYGQLVVGRRE